MLMRPFPVTDLNASSIVSACIDRTESPRDEIIELVSAFNDHVYIAVVRIQVAAIDAAPYAGRQARW